MSVYTNIFMYYNLKELQRFADIYEEKRHRLMTGNSHKNIGMIGLEYLEILENLRLICEAADYKFEKEDDI